MDPAIYQRIRLWSGITSITLNLALIWALATLAPAIDVWFLEWPLFLLLPGVVFGAQLLLFPFDYLVGHQVEALAGRTDLSREAWVRDWFQGVLRQSIVMTAAGLIFAMEPLRDIGPRLLLLLLLGSIMATTAFCLLGIVPGEQWLKQAPDPRFAASLQTELQRLGIGMLTFAWIRDGESRGVNGAAADFFKAQTVLLSESVARELTPREAALLVAREVHCVQTGYRWKSLVICLGWLLAGVAMGWNLPAAPGLQAALLPMAFVSSWSLLALFIWPSLSRRWMAAADRWLAQTSSTEEVVALLRKLQTLNATDTTLHPWKRRIFHPIPPLEDRIQSLP